MNYVFDSSVWISGLHFHGTPLEALTIASDVGQIAICPAIYAEIETALLAKFRWTELRLKASFEEFQPSLFEVETIGRVLGICRDPKDDMVLECAVAAGAEVIVTGDKDLLALSEYEGIRIVTPRVFLDELAAS